MVDTSGTGMMPDVELGRRVRKNFDLTPWGIISTLDLRRPVFQQTAAYGHFGREDAGFSWENVAEAATRLANG